MALNSGRLFRMAQNGQWVNEPIATAASGGGPLSPDISPNGRLAVFDYITTTSGGFQQETIYSYADRLTQRTEIDPAGFDLNDPSWIDDGRTMPSAGQQVWTEPVGPGDQTLWFDEFDTIGDPGANLSDGETAGTGVVVVRGSGEGESLQFYRRNGGGFDADPTPIRTFSEPTGAFADPTLAPGGGAVAWQEGDGVWTSAFPGDDCAGAAPRLTIPGGSQPDDGPANVNPARGAAARLLRAAAARRGRDALRLGEEAHQAARAPAQGPAGAVHLLGHLRGDRGAARREARRQALQAPAQAGPRLRRHRRGRRRR